ncbi:MAG: type II toxin-antitoxin system RelE/ParE family toxin [Verrucomicrobiales bacterium]|nr:type II toxin-antitoxin system RelE/ParE family toxin [Verrucomicrobiales bacterium]
MRLSYHPEARKEVVEAARFYEGKVPGLGAEFLAEFNRAVALILETPDRWRFLEHDLRRFLMRRFPYGILYKVFGEEVRILVVKHHSRHPDYWQGRLTE